MRPNPTPPNVLLSPPTVDRPRCADEDSAPDWRVGRLNGGDRHYPVVYYLHGGRPGNELAGAGMAAFVANAMEAGTVPPAIYVFVNGGPLSHYNYPHGTAYGSSAKQGMGCDVFINELIPHIDGESQCSSLCCPRPRRRYRLGEPPAG